MSIAVCISTLNEEKTIAALVKFFVDLHWGVFVVDNRSTDDTAYLAEVAGAYVFQPNTELGGLADCLMLAWELALNAGYDKIIQIDAGDSHNPSEAERLLAEAYLSNADIVVGSRFKKGSKYIRDGGPWYRPLLSRLASLAMRFAQSGSRYSDWTSGYRYFNKRVLEFLLTKKYIAKMHGWQLEVLAYAGEAGFKISEVPTTYRAGRSSFNKRVAWEAFQVFWHVLHHVGWVGSRLNEH
jgi:glycosyltransferase involved in cell wall biosynthesis